MNNTKHSLSSIVQLIGFNWTRRTRESSQGIVSDLIIEE